MYLVVYDIKNEEVVGQLLTKAKEFGEVNQALPSAFLLDTTENLNIINDAFLTIVSNNGRIMTAQITRSNINGWLGSDSVKWINSKTF